MTANATTARDETPHTVAPHDDAAPSADADGLGTDDAVSGSPGWPRWQRLGFRFLLLYFALMFLPSLVLDLLQTFAGAFAYLAETHQWTSFQEPPFSWPGKWATEVGKVEDGWQAVTTWLDQHGLAPYEVIHQRTGSGDTGHDIEKVLLIAAVATLGTALWSLLRRGPRAYPRLGRWLHVAARFQLAFVMIGYGSAKFYGGQFGELSLDRLTQPIGDTWPMTMVGTFMQASPPYELFGGIAEAVAGLLLFHPRTALMGAFVAIGVLTNVCALNWLCGVPVKLYSAHLLLIAVFLLLPYRHRLWALFVSNGSAPPVDLSTPRPRWLRWPVLGFAWVWVLTALWMTHVGGAAPRPWMQGQEKSALYGVWTVDKMLRDDQEVPASDASRWSFFAIDRGTLAWARDANGQRRYFDFAWDPGTGVAQVKTRGAASEAPAPWTCEQGQTTVPVDPPLLLHNEDRGHKVQGERRTLVLKGRLGEQQIELHAVEKVFRLQTGFRFRQELPDFW